MIQSCLQYVYEMGAMLSTVYSVICELCHRHAVAIENTAGNDSNRSGKLNLILPISQPSLSVTRTLGACLQTVWEHSLHSIKGIPFGHTKVARKGCLQMVIPCGLK